MTEHKVSGTTIVYTALLTLCAAGTVLESRAGYDLYRNVFLASTLWFVFATAVSLTETSDGFKERSRNWQFYVGDISIVVVLMLLCGVQGYERSLWDEIPWLEGPLLVYIRHRIGGFFSPRRSGRSEVALSNGEAA